MSGTLVAKIPACVVDVMSLFFLSSAVPDNDVGGGNEDEGLALLPDDGYLLTIHGRSARFGLPEWVGCVSLEASTVLIAEIKKIAIEVNKESEFAPPEKPIDVIDYCSDPGSLRYFVLVNAHFGRGVATKIRN